MAVNGREHKSSCIAKTRLHIIALHCSKQHFEPNLIKRELGIEHEFRKTWHDALKINLSIYSFFEKVFGHSQTFTLDTSTNV